jgi:hypothetical protein
LNSGFSVLEFTAKYPTIVIVLEFAQLPELVQIGL